MDDRAQVVLRDLESKQSTLLRWLDNVKVTTDNEQKNAEDILISAKGAIKEAESVRKSITAPMDEAKSRVMALFRPYTDRLQVGVNAINKALTVRHAQVVAQQEEERNARLMEEAARMEEVQEVAKVTGEVVEFQPLDDLVPIPSKTHQANLGSVTYREGIEVEIINANLVPRDLCLPSLKMIKARAESGITDIPGVVITKGYTPIGRRAA